MIEETAARLKPKYEALWAEQESNEGKSIETKVYEAIESFEAEGCTQDDILSMPQFKDTPYSSVTARFRSLINKGRVVTTGNTRIGKSGKKQRVLVASVYAG